ncbi:hypothetical protein EYF80_007415 [Liparis tanakae]|uniref:Uncharacterized protein n=1 Tax=Liparis tanakae TaxID=230148 RepID=A0A4Z2IXN5_9TELE|nr:hypothetical protein EYF80_007415 [Liparis tanakae]
MRLKRSYRYSLEELPFSRAKGMRYSSPSSTITSCLCLPTGPLECIKPCLGMSLHGESKQSFVNLTGRMREEARDTPREDSTPRASRALAMCCSSDEPPPTPLTLPSWKSDPPSDMPSPRYTS